MAPTPIELALATLLPTISFLPPELIHLATSLLAQSRSKAGSLKPEEEIARGYVCAHIACEKLAGRLDLEVGVARPPVRAAVYGKLKGYLEGVLLGGGEQVGRRRVGRSSNVATPTGSQAATTPVRKEVKTPTSAVKRGLPPLPVKEIASEGQKGDIPEFVMPMIRAICKSCKKPAAVPHINVGARAVVEEIVSRIVKRAQDSAGGEPAAKRRRRTPQSSGKKVESSPAQTPPVTPAEAITLGKWPALLVALFVFTAKKMGGEEDDEVGLREKATGAVKSFCEDGRRVLPEEVKALEGLEGSIKFYMLEAEDCGWLEMEWFQNVPEGIEEDEQGEGGDGSGGEGRVSEDEGGPVTPRRRPAKTPLRRKEKRGGKKADGGLEEEVGAAGLFAGLGTMFQPAVDWLSEERRADYAQWKKGMLREIVEVEQRA